MHADPAKGAIFHLTLFGGPEIVKNGNICQISPLQGGFLGLLYGGDSEHISREEVLSVFWPDDDPPAARRRLNQLLYSIKRRVGDPPPFETQGDGIRQSPERMSTDYQAFHLALREERFLDCAEYLKAGFMKHSEGRFTPEFTDWVLGRHRDLKRVLRGRVKRWLTQAEEQANWEAASYAAEVLLSLDPSNEETLRLFLRTRVRAGGYLDLETTVSDFAVGIEKVTGSPWEPGQETQSLIERIQVQSDAVLSNWASQLAPTITDPPLSGRETELNLLRRTVSAPPHRALRGILVLEKPASGRRA